MGSNFDGTLLDERYEIQARLASGGMAVVYRAWDTRLCRPVAIKAIRESATDDVTRLARFRREARTAAQLHSPYIVEPYDFFKEHDGYFLVMELVDGLHLKNYILARGRLAPADALLIGEQVCLALSAAHQHGFLHRDIKPQNILLDRSGNVKLADFGIVRVVAARGLTTEGIVLGTADYISPEQAQGLRLGPTTDIYSLGVVLYEMLSGVLPFNGTTSLAVAMQHATMPPPPLRGVVPEIPRSVETLVHRALAKDPKQRFQSAREMGLALQLAREALRPRSAEFLPTGDTAMQEAIEALDWRGLAHRLRDEAVSPHPSGDGRQSHRGRAGNSFPGSWDAAAALAPPRPQEIPIVPVVAFLAVILCVLLLGIVFLHAMR
jgi:eukaryotic-like serine/threonine-protein kinase